MQVEDRLQSFTVLQGPGRVYLSLLLSLSLSLSPVSRLVLFCFAGLAAFRASSSANRKDELVT
jgi:hypothetical protein